MNIIFIILIFIIFIMPFSYLKRAYTFDASEHKISKILNIIISIILIIILSSEDSNLRTILTDFSEFKQIFFVSLGGINRWIIFMGKILLIAFNIYLVVILINIVQRSKKYRKRLVQLLILYIPLKGLDIYRMIFNEFDEPWTNLMLYSILTSITFFLPIFIFYVSKPVKDMMIIDEDIKKEILISIKSK